MSLWNRLFGKNKVQPTQSDERWPNISPPPPESEPWPFMSTQSNQPSAPPTGQARPSNKLVMSTGDFPTYVAGVSYYQRALKTYVRESQEYGDEIWTDDVQLVPENDNPVDRNAVRVEIEGSKIGYLSRADAKLYRRKYGTSPRPCAAIISRGCDNDDGDIEDYDDGDSKDYRVHLDLVLNDIVVERPDSVPCPYCSVILSPAPKRKKKCPHCGQAIFLRDGAAITEAQAMEADSELEIDQFVGQFNQWGITLQKFDEERERLSKTSGISASVNEVKWAMLNRLVARKRDPRALMDIYKKMIRIAEWEGKDASHFRAEREKASAAWMRKLFSDAMAQRADLRSGWVVTVHTCGDGHVCAHCQEASKRKYTPEEFLTVLPIPIGCQDANGCRCWFGLERE